MALRASLALLTGLLALASGASILDLLDWGGAQQLVAVPQRRQERPERSCLCKGPACVCCVDFNITLVDIGGPGCVHMKYVSPDEGFSVNVSYGKNLIHSSKIQGANPAPICLEVFGAFAQVCAKLHDLAPTPQGLRGCLQLEPKLLGESQLEFPIGCFKSTAGGMEMEDSPAEVEETTEENTTEEFDVGFLTDLVKTAEKGIAFLSNFLDIPAKSNETTTTQPASDAAQDAAQEAAQDAAQPDPQRRASKNIKHPNQL